MIRERISSSTVLLLAYTGSEYLIIFQLNVHLEKFISPGKNLRYLNIRRNAIILRCDWPRSPDWSAEFYSWLRRSSRSYADLEREVSQILGFRWSVAVTRASNDGLRRIHNNAVAIGTPTQRS